MTLPSHVLDDRSKVQLLKDTICKDSTDDELELFAYTCKRLGLDPFARQIHPVKRFDSTLNREVMTIQTGIDGYRLIADRTGRYAPGAAPTFQFDKNGNLFSATSYVKKMTSDGTWHVVEATAHYREYVALKRDGKPNFMWATKPYIMLSKCSEALALRKAFPAELSGVYTKEEMDQANNPTMPSMHQKEFTEKDVDSFVTKWKAHYDESVIAEYIDARSTHFNKSVFDTVKDLAHNEDGFVKEINQWIEKQKKDERKDSD